MNSDYLNHLVIVNFTNNFILKFENAMFVTINGRKCLNYINSKVR